MVLRDLVADPNNLRTAVAPDEMLPALQFILADDVPSAAPTCVLPHCAFRGVLALSKLCERHYLRWARGAARLPLQSRGVVCDAFRGRGQRLVRALQESDVDAV